VFGIVLKATVAFGHFFAVALKETAFHEDPLAIDFDEDWEPGGAGGAVKMDSHGRENGRVMADCKMQMREFE